MFFFIPLFLFSFINFFIIFLLFNKSHYFSTLFPFETLRFNSNCSCFIMISYPPPSPHHPPILLPSLTNTLKSLYLKIDFPSSTINYSFLMINISLHSIIHLIATNQLVNVAMLFAVRWWEKPGKNHWPKSKVNEPSISSSFLYSNSSGKMPRR